MNPWHVRAHELVSVKVEKDGFEFWGSPILGLKDRSDCHRSCFDVFFRTGARSIDSCF